MPWYEISLTGSIPPFLHHSPQYSSPIHPCSLGPPLQAFFKLNFDRSVWDFSAASGVIIRDYKGTFIQATSFNFGSSSVLIAEASPLHQGIQIAQGLGIKNLIIEGDNLLVIKALRKSLVHTLENCYYHSRLEAHAPPRHVIPSSPYLSRS